MENIKIDEIEYKVVSSDAFDLWGILDKLKPMQAHRYYDKYIYITETNDIRACYISDFVDN